MQKIYFIVILTFLFFQQCSEKVVDPPNSNNNLSKEYSIIGEWEFVTPPFGENEYLSFFPDSTFQNTKFITDTKTGKENLELVIEGRYSFNDSTINMNNFKVVSADSFIRELILQFEYTRLRFIDSNRFELNHQILYDGFEEERVQLIGEWQRDFWICIYVRDNNPQIHLGPISEILEFKDDFYPAFGVGWKKLDITTLIYFDQPYFADNSGASSAYLFNDPWLRFRRGSIEDKYYTYLCTFGKNKIHLSDTNLPAKYFNKIK